MDCLSRCANSSWWEWSAGSRSLFWRWPEEYKIPIWDGVKPWIKGPLPEYPSPTTWGEGSYNAGCDQEQVECCDIQGLGDGDVRVVYDGTKSGLNGQLWAPWFPLPTIDTHLWYTGPGFYMGDIDFSEQFLNFMLHEKLRKYAGWT
jgi:hypothetical protein